MISETTRGFKKNRCGGLRRDFENNGGFLQKKKTDVEDLDVISETLGAFLQKYQRGARRG